MRLWHPRLGLERQSRGAVAAELVLDWLELRLGPTLSAEVDRWRVRPRPASALVLPRGVVVGWDA